MVFILPETLRVKRDEQDIRKSEKPSVPDNMKRIFLPMLSMLTEPPIILITLYNTVVYASLYVLVGIKIRFFIQIP